MRKNCDRILLHHKLIGKVVIEFPKNVSYLHRDSRLKSYCEIRLKMHTVIWKNTECPVNSAGDCIPDHNTIEHSDQVFVVEYCSIIPLLDLISTNQSARGPPKMIIGYRA